MTDVSTITTFNVYARQLEWMVSHKKNKSEFVRSAIDLAIDAEEGPANMLIRLKDRHEKLMVELHTLEEQMEGLGTKSEEFHTRRVRGELLKKLAHEVRFGCGPDPMRLTQIARGLDLKLEDWEIEEIVEEATKEV